MLPWKRKLWREEFPKKDRLLNQQLIQNNSELKEINEELDRFAFVASHDLQEPLRKILLFNNLISNSLDRMK